MLNVETARRIGINACIDKLGREFVKANKEYATSAYGETDEGVFCFVGVDNIYQSKNTDSLLVLDSNSEFLYRASCNVNLYDGMFTFVECVLPG